MQLRLGLSLTIITLSLIGCARFGVSNGSLDYKHAQTLEPLQVPADLQMRPQQALYPAPKIDAKALQQATDFSNKYGNRFEMPRPQANTVVLVPTGSAPSKPQLVTDGNGIPLIKIDGASTAVWQYLLAAASVSNLDTSANKKTVNQLDIRYQDKQYSLRLTPTGTSNTLGVYDDSNNYIDAKIATDILTLIYQNWPA